MERNNLLILYNLLQKQQFQDVALKYFSWVLNTYKQLRDLEEILSRKLEMLKVLYF